jgi:hypothetical protein
MTSGLFFLFIFEPPQFMNFSLESPGQGRVIVKFNGLYPSDEVTVVVAMAIVVAEHPAMIQPAASRIDVRQVVADNRSVGVLPNLFPQRCAGPGSTQRDPLVQNLPGGGPGWLFPAHIHENITART